MRLAALLALVPLFLCLGADAPKRLTAVQRLESSHLEAVHEQRIRWSRDRVYRPLVSVYNDYRAVIHIHAEDAEHTLGKREQVLAAAKDAGVKVVMWTDHRGPKPETWRGIRDGVLFMPGSEDDHALRFPFPQGDLKFWSHLEEIPNPLTEGFVGTEIYNRHTDAVVHKEVYDYIKKAMEKPLHWRSLVDRLHDFPDEVFGAGTDNLPEFLAKWDAATAQRPFTGIGANDAHRNQVFRNTVFDPYEVAFRNLSTHILARDLTENDIRESLIGGHAYVAHDWLCEPSGFQLIAVNNLGVFDMGDPVPLYGSTHLRGSLPIAAKVRIIRDGAVLNESTTDKVDLVMDKPGVYRMEAWLNIDGEDRPWLYTNAFYARQPTPGDLQLPSNQLAPDVVASKDITYVEGKPEDANKHKLDVYAPKNKQNAPVLFFVHGGSWRQGDRSQYPALANRFVKAGYVVVIPSYRLMPANPHPAQIEDVASAFAWTYEYISKYGGDPKRIAVAGHSAGGHLVALLALEPQWLERHKLPPDSIRGVAALSGVYDVTGVNQFGDEATRKAASPLTYVHKDAAPFLVTYCQWDYFGLPSQARRLDAELRKAFVPSKLVYIPGENHISEIVNVWRDGDPTASAMLEFMASVTAPRQNQ